MLEVRKDPERLLTEALSGWRRVEGSEGWLLDHHATYSTDPDLSGPGGSMAVPGPTWLATLAVSKFGYVSPSGIETGRLPSGWVHIDGRNVFVWPLWRLPASGNTLDAVWNVGWRSGDWELTSARNGALHVRISKTHGVPAPNSILHNVDLDIFTMCAAVRPPQGPLAPVPVLTRRKPTEWSDYPAWQGWDWTVPKIHDYADGPGWA